MAHHIIQNAIFKTSTKNQVYENPKNSFTDSWRCFDRLWIVQRLCSPGSFGYWAAGSECEGRIDQSNLRNDWHWGFGFNCWGAA